LAQDFYAGKQITLIVGSGVGGGYDHQARLVARHLGRHIAGNPPDHRAEHAGRRQHGGHQLHVQHGPARMEQ